MSRFTDALIVTPMADGKTWIVLKDFGYDVGHEDSGDRIDVAIGFQTDFASVPRIFWFIIPKWGRYGNAAIIHDWLYWTQERPRWEADHIFREGMGILGVGSVTKWVMHNAVRLFGWFAWIRNRADRVSGCDRVISDLEIKSIVQSRRPRAFYQVVKYIFRRRTF